MTLIEVDALQSDRGIRASQGVPLPLGRPINQRFLRNATRATEQLRHSIRSTVREFTMDDRGFGNLHRWLGIIHQDNRESHAVKFVVFFHCNCMNLAGAGVQFQ